MCELTEGRTTTCDSVGGARQAFLWAIKDSNGLSNYDGTEQIGPTIVDGEITDFNLKTGKYLYPFLVESESVEATTDSIGEKANNATAHEHSTILTLFGNTKEDIAAAIKYTKGRVGVALALNDGTYEVFHYEAGIGGKVKRSRSIGKMLEDPNGAILTITSKQTLPEMKVSSTLVNSLLPPP